MRPLLRYACWLSLLCCFACAHSQATPVDPAAVNDPAYHEAFAQCSPLTADPVPGYFCIGPLFIVAPVVLVMETSRACARSTAEEAFCKCMADKGFPVKMSNPPADWSGGNGMEKRRD